MTSANEDHGSNGRRRDWVIQAMVSDATAFHLARESRLRAVQVIRQDCEAIGRAD